MIIQNGLLFMVRWQAIGPISVRLEDEGLSHDNISVYRYDKDQLDKLLKEDKDYWSRVSFSLQYKSGYWLKLDFEVRSGEEPWRKAVNQVRLLLETLGLFKSSLGLLTIAGLYIKKIGEGSGVSGHFGWEIPTVGKPHYLLKKTEYDDFIDLLTKYKGFVHNDRIPNQSSKQLKRINLARGFFARYLQTFDLVERHIFLSVALEALVGEGQHELKYRYSNRAALLLGDDIKRRTDVYGDIQKAYNTRSDILHGRVKWTVKPEEVLVYNEIIRQMILRSISLYMRGYQNVSKALDKCMHDSKKHAKLLKDAKAHFGKTSEYKEPEEFARSRGWAVRK